MDNLDVCKKDTPDKNGNSNEFDETPVKKVKTTICERDQNSPRDDYIDWDEYFMAIAFLSAKRSKDPCTQVGACIVNRDHRIVGIGYNGMPTGCSDKQFPWGKKNKMNKMENKYLYVCHAEMNAILNKNSADVRDCRIYVALFPCNECAKLIIQAGISEVVYMSDKHAHKVTTQASKRMFSASNVKYWSVLFSLKFNLNIEKIYHCADNLIEREFVQQHNGLQEAVVVDEEIIEWMLPVAGEEVVVAAENVRPPARRRRRRQQGVLQRPIEAQQQPHAAPRNMDNLDVCKKNTPDKNGNSNEFDETPVKKVKTTICERDQNSPRDDYIDWDEYFMAIAFLSAKRSKDPCTQVGACIVNRDHRIVGIGYNGMPTGCSDKQFPWGKKNKMNKMENKYLYVCHAEMNAILNKNSADVRDCRIYVALFPCNECAKLIIQAGISEVVYMSDKHAHKVTTQASKRMFSASNVKYWQYTPKSEKIVIDFSEIDWNKMSQMPETPAKNNGHS
ncbi:uncharacterized protein LOC111048622 [Nilaparvata lugens]|uniref:uncharacterized protein LOC111048622 n=1 Tax=Nilaparvata lugens TaxID=108931 RepID=UPI00193EA4C5|nr:uncharacterized protein LOC111048622 [Nilaparvata lugens]